MTSPHKPVFTQVAADQADPKLQEAKDRHGENREHSLGIILGLSGNLKRFIAFLFSLALLQLVTTQEPVCHVMH